MPARTCIRLTLTTAGSPAVHTDRGALYPQLHHSARPRRSATEGDAIWLATGIFVSIVNIFLSLLNLFGE